jgi:hypothetical protein
MLDILRLSLFIVSLPFLVIILKEVFVVKSFHLGRDFEWGLAFGPGRERATLLLVFSRRSIQ